MYADQAVLPWSQHDPKSGKSFTIAIMNYLRFRVLALFLLLTGTCAAQSPQTELPRVTLSAGIHQIQTQVARTSEQHSIGLMFRTEMPQHEGMLFEFQAPSQQCFWMKNTLIPLTAAFVAGDGNIVNLEDMQAQTTVSHCSAKPVRFVLEVNQGWFAKRGIKAGTKLRGPMFQTPP